MLINIKLKNVILGFLLGTSPLWVGARELRLASAEPLASNPLIFSAINANSGKTPSRASENPSEMTMEIFEANLSEISPETPAGSENPLTSAPTEALHTSGVTPEPAAQSASDREIYLTFDDGPVRGTGNVLKVLKEEGVDASMFFVGRHVQKRPHLYELSQRMPNILIANHTYSHANGHYRRFYHDTYGVMSDVEHAQLILGGRKYLRLAGRNVWRLPEVTRDDRAIGTRERIIEQQKYDTLARDGFFIYGWDAEWRFDHHTGRPLFGAQEMARKIENIYRHGRSVQRGKIVLLAHDFMFRDAHSVNELRRFIETMKSRGWHFRKIDRYSRLHPEPLYIARYYKKPRLALRNAAPATGLFGHRQAKQNKNRFHRQTISVLAERQGRYPHIDTLSLQHRLIDAVKAYEADKVESLLKQGAQVNARDDRGQTALNAAVKANSILLVKKLLQAGADLRHTDARGENALSIAKNYHRTTIENFLLEHQKTATSSKPPRHLASAESTSVTTVANNRAQRNPLSILRF